MKKSVILRAAIGLAALTHWASAQTALIPLDATWRYSPGNVVPANGWATPSFDDSAWASGPAELGFGDGDEVTLLPPGQIAYTFRHTFNVANPAAIPTLRLGINYDDGVVVYLNGVEIARRNMGATSLTSFAILNHSPENVVERISAPTAASLLVAGENVLAVSVHQVALASSDVSFELELLVDENSPPSSPSASFTGITGFPLAMVLHSTDIDGDPLTWTLLTAPSHGTLSGTLPNLVYTSTPGFVGADAFNVSVSDGHGGVTTGTVAITINDLPIPPPGTYVTMGSVWRYDTTPQVTTAWNTPAYNDSNWAAGPGQLGFGDGDERTVIPHPLGLITAYFRHEFNVAPGPLPSALVLRVLYDDGAVVYLNGVELGRVNMPAGPITSNTLAFGAADNSVREIVVPAAALVVGRNVVSAEVHQTSPFSSDISFDLNLKGGTPVNHPPIAQPLSLDVNADGTVVIPLAGLDPDGDDISFQVLALPSQGTLDNGVELTYTASATGLGLDGFSYVAFDGQAFSVPAQVTINIINLPPVAVASVSTLVSLFPGGPPIIIVPQNGTANVTLSAEGSFDPEGLPLEYTWNVNGILVGTGSPLSLVVPIGPQAVELVVSDLRLTGSDTENFSVVTAATATLSIIDWLNASGATRQDKTALEALLRTAAQSFQLGHMAAGIAKLQAFETVVRAKILRSNPALAAQLTTASQTIMISVPH